MINKTEILKDLANKKLNITRGFNAPVDKVWKAWTDSTLLDQWWAPRPWKAQTKIMNFEEGGLWLYCMAGPNGEKAWCRVDYKTILPGQKFTAVDAFCDEDGNQDSSFPIMDWLAEFEATGTGSRVNITVTFDTDEDLQKLVEMGFEGGFSMALGNLDELLEA